MGTPTPTNMPGDDRERVPPQNAPNAPPHVPNEPRTEMPPPLAAPPPRPQTRNTALIIAVIAVVALVPVALCVAAALFAGTRFFTTSGQIEQTATSRYQFAVPGNPAITISNTAGQVTITKGTTEQVTVVATKFARSSSNEAARDQLDEITVTAVPTADGARITAATGPSNLINQRRVNLRITVPETSNLTVTMSAGTLSITSITGRLDLTSSAGTVDLNDMTVQGATTIKVSAGTLNFNGALANDARVTATVATGNANIRLPRTSATHLDASARIGGVNVTDWTATTQRSGAGQSTAFDLNPQPTSTMTVRVDVGSINISAR
ncbi:MAG TPA: DUF4097 family beta strand repeat-containing protein [Ktedonobacterales bacterium]|nr:DUF4097 family beta strand repeat-containing protein [Ktedonobacterales bacterium]